MGFRFRRRIGPKGLKLNITKNGISSVSIGGRGLSYNIPVNRKGGARTTVGIPGTGLSWDHQEPANNQRANTNNGQRTYKEVPEPITSRATTAKDEWKLAAVFALIGLPILVVWCWAAYDKATPQRTRTSAAPTEKTAEYYAAKYEAQAAADKARKEEEQERQRKLQQRRENIRAMNAAGYYKGTRGGCFRYTSGGNKDYVSRSICNSYLNATATPPAPVAPAPQPTAAAPAPLPSLPVIETSRTTSEWLVELKERSSR